MFSSRCTGGTIHLCKFKPNQSFIEGWPGSDAGNAKRSRPNRPTQTEVQASHDFTYSINPDYELPSLYRSRKRRVKLPTGLHKPKSKQLEVNILERGRQPACSAGDWTNEMVVTLDLPGAGPLDLPSAWEIFIWERPGRVALTCDLVLEIRSNFITVSRRQTLRQEVASYLDLFNFGPKEDVRTSDWEQKQEGISENGGGRGMVYTKQPIGISDSGNLLNVRWLERVILEKTDSSQSRAAN
ncbi:hypothetical protein DFH07DRAFT_1016979 [Mycena maculata]|uniref:Uncharacterized protein n=1 Tax=Mycena maculata TaxID=230809 RepID=A0AAD7JFW3_9AGAR|nr:hypothetical protein DFH07DRAFT_1016979 [Mycena maculata]